MQPRRFLPISNGDPRVGLPFIITVRRRQLTYHHLCTVICSYAAHSVSAFRTKMLSLPPPTTSITGGILPGLRSSSSSTQQVFTFNLSEFCRTFESTASSESNASAASSSSAAASTSSSSSTLPPPPPPPHFVHFQTAPLSPASNDVLAPFIIRRTNLGVNKEAPEAEVAPPLLMIRTAAADEEMAPAASDDSDMSDASEASTVVGGGGGGGGGNETSSSADEDFQQQQQQQGQATGFEVASQHSSSNSSSSSGFKSATSSESDGASSSSSSSASALESVLEMRMRRHGHHHHPPHHPPHHHHLPSLTEQAAMLSTKMEQDLPEEEEEEEEEPLDDDDQVEGAEDEDEDDDDEYEDENGEIRSSKDSSRDKRTSTASAAAAVSVQFDNDRPLDLGDVYYLCADWIDVAGFPRGVGVSLSESYTTSTSTRHGGGGGGFMNSFSAGSRSLLFGGGGSSNSSSKFSSSSNSGDDDDDDISLDDCFQLFSEPEVLGQANCWKCPACRAPRAATKQLSFNLRRLPPILVVQLKRFKMAPNSIHRRKLGQLVKFPISGLDLRKMQQPGQDLCGGGSGENSLDNVPPPIYDLYAVVNHMGEAFMGHYTAYARAFNGEMGKWGARFCLHKLFCPF